MSTKRTKNISAAAIRDAMGVAGGIYRMNATAAMGYAFNAGPKEVTSGEFFWKHELERVKADYEGIILYTDKACVTTAAARSGIFADSRQNREGV